MLNALTDEQLIHYHLGQPTTTCHEELYHRYADKVYRQCLNYTQDSQQAQDYVHDIFLKVFAKLDHFQQRSRFSSWLHAVTHNYCLDQLRRARRMPLVFLDEARLSLADDQHEWTINEERIQLRWQIFMELSTADQTLLRLKYEKGFSLRELAGLYALKVDVVKMRLKRSRNRAQRSYSLVQNGEGERR